MTLPVLQHYTREDKELQQLVKHIKQQKQPQNKELKSFKECFKEISIMDNLIMRGNRFIIPREVRPDILAAAHEGHPGIVAMLRHLRQSVWWPGMTKDVNTYVETCNESCAAAVPRNSPPPMEVQETPDYPWQRVAADFKGPIIGNKKTYYFHVIIDLLSRWPEVAVVKGTGFKELVPSMEKVWALHGIPETITSDNGPPYNSREWKRYAKSQGFQHTPCSPEHPEGNGVAERFMATIVKVVHAAMAENKDPKIEVDRRLLNYRNTVHPSTGKTPSQLMMGRTIRTKIPQLIKSLDNKADLEEARRQDQQTRLRRKELRDQRKTAKEKDYKIGDRVLISQRKTTTKPPFDPKSFEIEEIKGTQIKASRGSKTKVRNMAKVKLLKPRPQHLLRRRTKHQTVQESSDEDWLELLLPQEEQPIQVDQVPDWDKQEQRELQQHQDQEEQDSNPDLQEQEGMYDTTAEQKPKRTKKNIERLGIVSKATSPSRSQRKKKQGEARRRAKEKWVFTP